MEGAHAAMSLSDWLPSRPYRQPVQAGEKVTCAFLDVEDGDWISLEVDYSADQGAEEELPKPKSGAGRAVGSWLMRMLRSSADVLLASDIFSHGEPADWLGDRTAGEGGKAPQIPYNRMRVDKKACAVGSFKTVHKGRLRGKGAVEDVAVVFARRDGETIMREECLVMERLGKHPHLCQLLGVSQDPTTGDPVLVMELADLLQTCARFRLQALGSLDKVLADAAEQGDAPRWSVLLTAAMQVCDGMVQMAEHDFIHRDLATRNILVFSFDLQDRTKVRVKICDYGLAASIGKGGGSLTTWGAPQVQAEGKGGERPPEGTECAHTAPEADPESAPDAHDSPDPEKSAPASQEGAPDAHRADAPTDAGRTPEIGAAGQGAGEGDAHPARVPGVAPSEIPWRFLAPEVIESRSWSEKSDVWSFGVCMWEMFSPGCMPYSEEDDDEYVGVLVRAGLRLERPKTCPLAVFAVMQRCWADEAFVRPDFHALRMILEDSYAATSAMTEAAFIQGHLCTCQGEQGSAGAHARSPAACGTARRGGGGVGRPPAVRKGDGCPVCGGLLEGGLRVFDS